MSPPPKRSLTLADVIDLELQLAADREADGAALRRRDAQIAGQLSAAGIDPRRTTGPQLFLPWLEQLRALEGTSRHASAGQQVQRMLGAAGATLAISGLALGLSVASGWLLQAGGKPVNVVFFLAAVLGTQMPLLLLWLVAIVPPRWLRRVPGAEAIHWLWSQLAQLPPRLLGWVAARMSRESGQLIGRVRGEFSRLGWIYGSLRLWLLVRLTQVFAVTFNLGLIAGFVLLSYGSDPAFGWKSTLMTYNQLHAATRVVAAPWSWMPGNWSQTPTLADVDRTRYWTSAEEIYRGDYDPWSHWWPFLLAALVCYGLLPRLITLSISQFQVVRCLSFIRLNHSEFDRLAERLARTHVETQATEPEEGGSPGLSLSSGEQTQAWTPTGGPIAALVWSGVQLPHEQLQRLIVARLGGSIAAVHSVGGLDPAQDREAIRSAKQQLDGDAAGRAALLVEVWEPPVGDYQDFIRELRQALGRSTPICVLLFDRDGAGRAVTARPVAAQIWRGKLAELGDPWLRVDSLVPAAAAEASA